MTIEYNNPMTVSTIGFMFCIERPLQVQQPNDY